MIIQGSDLLLALGASQASGEYRDESHGAASFAQFLPQNLEVSDPLLAFLAPSSQPPTRVLPLQLRLFNLSLEPSMSNLADVGEAVQQEQENRALKEILDALQDLFPAMIPGVLIPLHHASTATTEGVPTLAITPLSVADPTAPEPPVSFAIGNVPGAPLTETPESSHRTAHAHEASSAAPQIEAHTAGAPLPVALPAGEVALGNAVRENQDSETDATAVGAGRQQTGHDVPADASVLTSEDTSLWREGRTPSPAHLPAEGASGHALAHGDVSRFASHEAEAQRSTEQPPAAGLLRQAPPPEQQAVGSLRYFPHPHSTVLLQLDPPELGTLFVQVRQVDEQLTASFWAESSEVRSLLQAHFPNLNQVLSQQGLLAQQISLHLATGDGFAEQFGQFSQQHAAAQSFSHGNHGETPGGRQRDLDNATDRRQPNNGRVDITI